MVENLEKSVIFFANLPLFHKSFPPTTDSNKTGKTQTIKNTFQKANRGEFSSVRCKIAHVFSTPQKQQKSPKITLCACFWNFPQFPQALLILLFIIYIILSLYALRAKKSERVPRKDFCYEDYIQPPTSKRGSVSFDVRCFR